MRTLTRIILLAAAAVCGLSQGGQPGRRLQLDSPAGSKQLALVIGNAKYTQFNSLKNTVNDAYSMAQTLRGLRFEVILATDVGGQAMEQQVNQFTERLRPEDVALFYAAAHGVQVGGENYIIPTDFAGRNQHDLNSGALSVSALLDRMQGRGTRLNILILDACRDNPFSSGRSATRGLAAMNAGARGTFIAFAAAPGGVAIDVNPRNPQSPNGLFTEFLLQAMAACGWELSRVFDNTRNEVDRASGGQQTPYMTSGVVGSFKFRPESTGCRSGDPLPASPPPLPSPHTHPRTAVGLVGEWHGRYACADGGGGSTTYEISMQNGRLKVTESYKREVIAGFAWPGTVNYEAQWDERGGKLRLTTDELRGYSLVFTLSPDGERMDGVYSRHPSGCVRAQLRRSD